MTSSTIPNSPPASRHKHRGNNRTVTDEQRQRILAEAFQSGARVCDVARRYDVARSLIYQWRRAARRQAESVFMPAVLVDEPPEPASDPIAAIVIDLPGGGRVSIAASTPPGLAAAALKGLR